MKEDDRNIVTQASTHICSYTTNEDIHYTTASRRWEPPQKIIYDAPYVKSEQRTDIPGQIIEVDIKPELPPSPPRDRFGWILKLLVRIKILEGVKDE